MGTEVEIEIFDSGDFEFQLEKGFSIFEEMEQMFSRFRPDSILSQLNEQKQMQVPDIFLQVLQKSQHFFNISGGYFNPLIDISALGYDKSFESLGEHTQASQKYSDTDFQNVHISENTITLGKQHILDLGGIVKGYTVERVKEYLLSEGIKNFLINAGGDIYMSGKIEGGENCVVGIDNPFNEQELAATYEISGRATATSGTYKRKWKMEGKDHHHILNPHSGENPHDILSITLITPDAVSCDALATAGIAMGYLQAYDFFERQNIPALFITHDKKIIMTPGWKDYNLDILFSQTLQLGNTP